MMDDLISRQAVLSLPRNTTRNFFGEVVEETINVADVMELSSAEPQWIPVSERLPEDEGWYLVTDDSGGVLSVGIHLLRSFWKDGENLYTSHFSRRIAQAAEVITGVRANDPCIDIDCYLYNSISHVWESLFLARHWQMVFP